MEHQQRFARWFHLLRHRGLLLQRCRRPRSLTGSFAANSTLTATVVNTTTVPSPMGLLVVGTADTPTGVPEPSTYAMMFIGGAAIFMTRRRK